MFLSLGVTTGGNERGNGKISWRVGELNALEMFVSGVLITWVVRLDMHPVPSLPTTLESYRDKM